jgi:Na+-translocating ferredoxin:NAD+ oxidoreductase RnfG subunit
MGFLKRVAFYWGVVLGLATVAVAGIVALTYLFTGKFPIPSMEEAQEKPELQLMTPEEVVAVVREQVAKARAAEATKEVGGEYDEPE